MATPAENTREREKLGECGWERETESVCDALASDNLGHGVGASSFGDLLPQATIQRWLILSKSRRVERVKSRVIDTFKRGGLTLSLRGDICAMSAGSGDCLTSWLWLWLGCGCNISCECSPSALSELWGLPPPPLVLLPAVISELRRLIKLILSGEQNDHNELQQVEIGVRVVHSEKKSVRSV